MIDINLVDWTYFNLFLVGLGLHQTNDFFK